MASNLLESGFSRVFLVKNRASPDHAPTYQGLMRVGAATWDQGRVTSIFVPDTEQYGQFKLVSKIPGEPGLPQLTIEGRYNTDLSDLLQMVADGCDHDVQVHMGTCKNPRDFNHGWFKTLVLEAARPASYSTTDLGALDPAQAAAITETTRFDGLTMYELKNLSFAEKAGTTISFEVVAVGFCDNFTCGSCGVASDGCQLIFAVEKSSGGSPGILGSVIFSSDGGKTWAADPIDSLAANNAPTGALCVAGNLIVISQAANALSWAPMADILAGTETWAAATTGFVSTKGPNAIVSPSDSYTYIVGQGGYIYFTSDPTSGVSVQDAGVATAQNLLDVSAFDIQTVLAVGGSNAVVYTTNGGSTWTSVVGPAPGVALNACVMKSATDWSVGTATGRLYYTRNSGTTWAETAFPNSGTGVVRDIQFVTDSVGYMAHDTATPRGRILRTLDGGFSWYVLPEGIGSIPTNQRINVLGVCSRPNIVYGGGLNIGGTDGILVSAS